MSIQLFQELNSASFRGIPFLFRSHECEAGRKVVRHEYPNKKERFVEDLGGLLRVFRISGIVTGSKYKLNRDALIAALETPGIGTLIHPYFGTINVTPEPYILKEVTEKVGEAHFEMIFVESTENIFPSIFSGNLGYMNELAGEVFAAAKDAMTKAWLVDATYKLNYQNAKAHLNGVSNFFNGVVLPFDSNEENVSKYRENLNSFTSSIPAIVTSGSVISDNMGTLFNSLFDVNTDGVGKFESAKVFFKYGNNDELPPSNTVQQQELITNALAFNGLINVMSLTNAYIAMSLISFSDEDELLEFENIVNDQFYYCLDNSILDDETLNLLKSLRNELRIYLDSIKINIKRRIPISTNQTTLTVLTYAYYNSLDNDELIMNINKIYSPNNISGEIEIVTSQ